jgi:hypothetical protein
MRVTLVIVALIVPTIALALPDDPTLSRLLVGTWQGLNTRLNIALTAPGSWIHRTKATTRAENGGLNTAG